MPACRKGSRSKTAEDFFAQKYPDYEFLSAETTTKNCKKEGTTVLTEDLLEWADKVYVMKKTYRLFSKNEKTDSPSFIQTIKIYQKDSNTIEW